MHITAKDLWNLCAQLDETARHDGIAALEQCGLLRKANDPPRFYALTEMGEAVVHAAVLAAREQYRRLAPKQ